MMADTNGSLAKDYKPQVVVYTALHFCDFDRSISPQEEMYQYASRRR